MDKYIKFDTVMEYLRSRNDEARKCGHEETYFDLLTIIDGLKNMETIPASALDKDTNVPTKWIPVSEKEKLPENGRKVLVKADDVYYSMGQQNGVVIGWRNGNYWYTYTIKGEEYIRYPSKWMPLPEPYKEG